VAGAVLHVTGLDNLMRSVAVIGWAMLLFGLLLYWADRRATQDKQAEEWTLMGAVKLGLWQAVALIPGTSRSGITITGALTMGYTREDAARLSMLMSIPTILASAVLLGADAYRVTDPGVLRDAAIAAGMSFAAALAALALMMRLLRSVSYTPYVVYRVVLGVVLLGYAYT
ncbi:MAG: undecaprenyl-diphosphate phosphatase, partial [Pseudomonadota bacterium]|nr:undecaprenyl-diphosphate phosphatase [Pseudomonadota bacterium]